MTVPTFDPDRSTGIRAALASEVSGAKASRRDRRRRWAGRFLFGAVGVLAGVGVSGAAWASGWIDEGRAESDGAVSSLAGPEGVIPGSPIIVLLGAPQSRVVVGADDLTLTPRPETATHLRVWATCIDPGSVAWGFDPDGNNPGLGCGADDAGQVAWQDFELGDGDGDGETFYIDVAGSDDMRSSFTFQYAHHEATEWGVNAAGQTYGASTDEGDPDLVAAFGLDDRGHQIEGYVVAADLRTSPIGQPNNPEEALEYMEELERLAELHPEGYSLPLYESDGVTRIGSFAMSYL